MAGPRRDTVARCVRAGGVVSHYLDAGEGPTLLLLHGGEFGAGAEVTWDRCLPRLAERSRVIALDLLGFGRSDKVRDLVDQRDRVIRQVAEVLDVLCIDEVDVVGTSFSARLLLDEAARQPCRWPLRSLVAIGVGRRPPSRDVRKALSAFDGSEASMRPTMELLFHDATVRDDPEVLARRMALAHLPGAWQSGRAPTIGQPQGAPERPRPPIRDYAHIDRPTLLVRGEHDGVVPDDDFDDLAASVPDADTAVVTSAGHYPQVERPDRLIDVLEPFLHAVRQRAGES